MTTDDIRIIDTRQQGSTSFDQLKHNPTFDEAQRVMRFQVDRSLGWDKASPGDYVYKLIAFRLAEGPVTFKPMIQNEGGQGLSGRVVMLNYSSAPKLPSDFGGPDYFDRAVADTTDPTGAADFTFSRDGYIGPNGGPYAIWPAKDPDGQQVQFADCAKALGWLGSTDHLVANPVFLITQKLGGDPQPPDPTATDIIVVIDGKPTYRIPMLPLDADAGDNYQLIPGVGKIPMLPLDEEG